MGCTCDNCGCSGSENIVQIIGQKGDTGAAGATPIIQAGTTTTLAPGDPADVELVANGNNSYIYNFNIPAGADGTNGTNGFNGWSPILAVVTDGARRVLQITSWTGGTGTPPSSTNQFLGSVGIVSTAAAAVDIRGAAGAAATGGVPIGSSVEYGGIADLNPDPDTGAIYFLEDGRSLLRSSYTTLFSRIGTRFGSVDGTHFNIPNSTGRMAIGLDASVTAINTVGKTGGARTAVVAASNLPTACPWSITDPGHGHSMLNYTAVLRGGGPAGIGVSAGSGVQQSTVSVVNNTTGISMGLNAGGAQALDILNPFIVKNKLIRVL